MNSFIINKYLIGEFLKTFINMLLVFCCLGLILNLFEEINYFKTYDVGILMPLSIINGYSSILINLMLHFILSSMWVFIKLKNSRDIIALKTLVFKFKFSNFILFCIFIYFNSNFICLDPITATTVKYYEDVKGKYDLDKSHLASITANGIWVKEKKGTTINIIKSQRFEGDRLINVSIYKFDENYNLISRIESSEATIIENPWILQNGRIIEFKNQGKNTDFLTMEFESTFSKDKLSSIYSNLDTISFYNLITDMNDLVSKGYNPQLLNEKKHFYLSLPFFLILMVCLAGIFTLNSNARRQNTYYILLSIIVCVIIFYFKNFSTALGTTEKIPRLFPFGHQSLFYHYFVQ